MAKQLVNINDNSISRAVTSDYKKAICEYIWNGFDAMAWEHCQRCRPCFDIVCGSLFGVACGSLGVRYTQL